MTLGGAPPKVSTSSHFDISALRPYRVAILLALVQVAGKLKQLLVPRCRQSGQQISGQGVRADKDASSARLDAAQDGPRRLFWFGAGHLVEEFVYCRVVLAVCAPG